MLALNKESREAVIENLSQQFPDVEKSHFEEALKKMCDEGASLSEAMEISNDVLEGMYDQAYRYYNMGQYKKAHPIFSFLFLMNYKDSRFVMGLGACAHMMQNYPEAIQAYECASLQNLTDPVPLYHAVDCYINLDDHPNTVKNLKKIIAITTDKPEHRVMRDRAIMMLKNEEENA